MFEKRLTPQHHWLTILPAILIVTISVLTLLGAQTPGKQPREALFDIFSRVSARPATGFLTPASDNGFAIVTIDKESIEKVGPWPWPRTELAAIIDAVKAAGAKNVVLTVPIDGPDPLSPENVGKFWFERAAGTTVSPTATAVAALPSNDAALASSLETIPSASAVGVIPNNTTDFDLRWDRIEASEVNWLGLRNKSGTLPEYFALSAIPLGGPISDIIAPTTMISVSALPADDDGIVRRSRVLWSADDQAVPSSALAAVRLSGSDIAANLYEKRRVAAGIPAASLGVDAYKIHFDPRGNVLFYPPQNLDVITVPAWRMISGSDDAAGWAVPLSNKTVFIGETITPEGLVTTARGQMSVAAFHALMADQLKTGVSLERPDWAGYIEAGLALFFGVGAVAAAIFMAPRHAFGASATIALLFLFGSFGLFKAGILLDPLPTITTALGAPLALALSVFATTMLRDDAVRGAFHGALPASAMQKLQKDKNGTLLKGVRRHATVLSCMIRLPDEAKAQFVSRPDDLVRFTAHTNDRLRRAILDLGGTVDFGEDGRLLGYWNAPEEQEDHIERACTCALQMIDDMNILTQDLQAAAFARKARIIEQTPSSAFEQGCLEVGLSTDIGFCGPVGRGTRNRYSVIGPAVAFASHLRSRSSLYGPAIVCDEAIYNTMRHHFAFLDLDTLKVNDEKLPRAIYGLAGNPFLKSSKAFRELADAQRDLLHAWREGKLDEAQGALTQLKNLPGSHNTYTALFEKRIQQARQMQSLADADQKKWDSSVTVII